MTGLYSCASYCLRTNLIGKGLSPVFFQQHRMISSSTVLFGKRNVRKFFLANKRGTKIFRRERNKGNLDWLPVYTEVQETGFKYDGSYHVVPEMVPEFIVPDLTDFQLKPYVSYRAADIYQTEFTAQDLFDVVYKTKISKDFEENKLNEDGSPIEPSEMEKLNPDDAWVLARKTGSDIFSERIPRLWECLEKSLIDDEPKLMQVTSYDLTHPSEKIDKSKQAELPLLQSSSTDTPTNS